MDAIWKSGVTGLVSGGLSGGLDVAFASNNLGFWEGAGVGALTGATAYGIDGYLNGKRGEDLLLHMGKGALLTGAVNGLVSGISARIDGRNFWNGENYVWEKCCKVGYYREPIRLSSLRDVHARVDWGFTSKGKGLGISFGFDFGVSKWWQYSYYMYGLLTGEKHLIEGSNWNFPLFFKVFNIKP